MFLRTPKDSPHDVDIVNVGYCGPHGALGVSVEHAAKLMTEFQDEDGKPFTGKKLDATAKDWAEERGLVVVKAEPAQGTAEFPVEAADPPYDQPSDEEEVS